MLSTSLPAQYLLSLLAVAISLACTAPSCIFSDAAAMPQLGDRRTHPSPAGRQRSGRPSSLTSPCAGTRGREDKRTRDEDENNPGAG
jgi:hypothetical protein